mmetsp:Transcript_14583/g.43549  ORF Transcript_14583/g.43549 Transcript_14583/m.43549 type:complete len:209 (-) Transcript_14583:962-1588(-)
MAKLWVLLCLGAHFNMSRRQDARLGSLGAGPCFKRPIKSAARARIGLGSYWARDARARLRRGSTAAPPLPRLASERNYLTSRRDAAADAQAQGCVDDRRRPGRAPGCACSARRAAQEERPRRREGARRARDLSAAPATGAARVPPPAVADNGRALHGRVVGLAARGRRPAGPARPRARRADSALADACDVRRGHGRHGGRHDQALRLC